MKTELELRQVRQVLRVHVGGPLQDEALNAGISACLDCSQACVACADACLAELRPEELTRCITLNQSCADLCSATLRVLSRQTEADLRLCQSLLTACALACRLCADECRMHAEKMEHCRGCADACDACVEACARTLAALEGVAAGVAH
jgi:hypothetical protein